MNREPSQKALVRKLKYHDAPELKQPCEAVAVGDDVDLLIDDLLVTMRHHFGAGLSAPQIGILKRVAVVEVDGTQIILVNPRIVRFGRDRVRGRESCLSLPGTFIDVERFRLCQVESLGRKYSLSNWAARTVQHEMDHLDGILITDREAK